MPGRLARGLLIAAALVAGCQRAPATPAAGGDSPASDPSPSTAAALKAEGDDLMRIGDHRAAADAYRRAVALEPEDVPWRFALATAYTFLDRRTDAIEQFREVLARAIPGSVEYREARRWLAKVGVSVEATEPASTGPAVPASTPPVDPAAPFAGGRLVGTTQWPGIDPTVRAISGEISIAGIEPATESIKRSRPLRLGKRYNFYDIPAGRYRLVARMANRPEDVTLWDQEVTVVDGTPTEVALTPATAHVSPETFPPPLD